MSIFQNVTKASLIKGSALLIVLAGAEGAYATKWGVFGFLLTGIPLWCFGVLGSTGGILFFLGPMVFGSDPTVSVARLSRDPAKMLFLYLRPFELDARTILQLTVGASAGVLVYSGLLDGLWWVFAFVPLIINISKEQGFKDAFEPLGEFIAFGRPGEKLSPIGASRVYADVRWKQVMANYMARARLVIVRPGNTDSIRWEVEEVLRIVPPERILFYLRFRGSRTKKEQAYEDFRSLFYSIRHTELPRQFGKSVYLVFDTSWNPYFIREANRPSELIRQVISHSGNIASDRFRPVLRALGIEIPSRPNNLLHKVTTVLPWIAALPAVGLVIVAMVVAIVRVGTALALYFLNQR